jgi:hypothetical protein
MRSKAGYPALGSVPKTEVETCPDRPIGFKKMIIHNAACNLKAVYC